MRNTAITIENPGPVIFTGPKPSVKFTEGDNDVPVVLLICPANIVAELRSRSIIHNGSWRTDEADAGLVEIMRSNNAENLFRIRELIEMLADEADDLNVGGVALWLPVWADGWVDAVRVAWPSVRVVALDTLATADDYQNRLPIPPNKPLRHGGTKRVLNVGNRHGFNGALLPLPSGNVLCLFRAGEDELAGYIAILDRDYNLIVGPVRWPYNRNCDARLITHNGGIWLATHWYNGGTRMELRRITVNEATAELTEHRKIDFDTIDNWPGYVKPKWEKNWAPFSHDGKMMFVYSCNPHRILEVDLDAGRASLVHSTWARWQFDIPGVIRLNSPPVRLADGTYLSTFHVRNNPNYWTGFYRFSGQSPFEVLSVTPHPVIVPGDSTGTCWRNHDLRLIFVQGMFIDEPRDTIELHGGDNDHDVITVTLGLADVLGRLRPVGRSESFH